MPSSPARSDRNYSAVLQTMSVAWMQESETFVAGVAAPFVPVEKKQATYYTYPQGEWNRLQMTRRGVGEEVGVGGYTISTDTYDCEKYGVGKDEDLAEITDADPVFSIDQDNSEWLANQAMMKADSLWQATVMLPATWTTDYDGVNASPSAGEFLQWDDSSSDCQKDVMVLQAAIHALIGRYANVMIVGADVHAQVITHPIVRDAIKHTDKTFIAGSSLTNQQLAMFFGVETYRVAGAITNTADKGATVSMGYITNAKDLWLGYVNPNPGKKKMSAAYTFAWTSPDGVANNGVVTRKYLIPQRNVERSELELYADVKIITADAGAFVDDLVP